MRVTRLTLALAAAVSTAAHAQRVSEVTGARLLAFCSSRAAAANCDGYLSGVADAYGVEDARPACIPRNVTGTQLREVTVRYLRAHPELASRPAVEAASGAFTHAFPCRK